MRNAIPDSSTPGTNGYCLKREEVNSQQARVGGKGGGGGRQPRSLRTPRICSLFDALPTDM